MKITTMHFQKVGETGWLLEGGGGGPLRPPWELSQVTTNVLASNKVFKNYDNLTILLLDQIVKKYVWNVHGIVPKKIEAIGLGRINGGFKQYLNESK